MGDKFVPEAVHRQCGSSLQNRPRSIQKLPFPEVGNGDADAWVIVVMKDPLASTKTAYRETAFHHLLGGSHAEVLAYPEFYEQPWILHSLVHAGYRLTSPESLTETAGRLLATAKKNSAEAGAALCILLYRAMEGALPGTLATPDLIRQAEQYLAIPQPDAHQFRWQISLGFALGKLAMNTGDLALARRRFAETGAKDVSPWGPSLATKTSEALFLAGWLAWCANEFDDCRRYWKQGVELGQTLARRPLAETLLNPDFPNLYDYGDGMRELTYALENVSMCVNGLHGLRLRDEGIPCNWNLIFNSFRAQRDQRDRLLHQAQQRVHRLCRELEHLRTDLHDRTKELDELRTLKEVEATLDGVSAFAFK